ncbi:MAG: hypothetical protein PHS86_11415 [Syntrophaceae bacterium]|nr:hypothetical protein [Syntrophaceae bacterium]
MLEDHEFCDDCPGCKPAILDMKTNRPLPPDDPLMQAVMFMWQNGTTYQERKAYIEVTLHNSRSQSDLILANSVFHKIKEIIQQMKEQEPF